MLSKMSERVFYRCNLSSVTTSHQKKENGLKQNKTKIHKKKLHTKKSIIRANNYMHYSYNGCGKKNEKRFKRYLFKTVQFDEIRS